VTSVIPFHDDPHWPQPLTRLKLKIKAGAHMSTYRIVFRIAAALAMILFFLMTYEPAHCQTRPPVHSLTTPKFAASHAVIPPASSIKSVNPSRRSRLAAIEDR
jgi:hypothetical protein